MNEQREQKFKDFIRGGQILQHNMRMWSQIMGKVVLACLLSFIMLNYLWFLLANSDYERYIARSWGSASFWVLLDSKHKQPFEQPSGNVDNVYSKDIVHSQAIIEIVDRVLSNIVAGLMYIVLIQFAIFYIALLWLRKSGNEKTQNTQIKGDLFVSNKELTRTIKRRKQASDLILANVPLVINKECQHFLFDGTTGAGKSTAIKCLMDQIRARGDRAIIYDKGCSLMRDFYQEEDVLLNPLDTRGAKWHLWNECRDSVDYDNMAVALIPRAANTSDPFWVDAARSVFSAIAFGMKNDKDKNSIKLLKYLLTSEMSEIKPYLQGTFAESLTSDKIEKTALSIRAVMATYLKCLKYVEDDINGFCIRDWIQSDEQKNWLFITSLGDRHESLKPLMTAWLDTAINSLISLTPDDNRRIWFILDEVSSLQVLPSLEAGLSESRKFGGCFVLGWQNIAQLRRVYGIEGARSLSALANTRFIYRQPDPDLAKWSASNLGEAVIDEVREGISYGANSMRDGVSISRGETTKPVISYSEVMNLDDLQCYLRLPGAFPLTKLKFAYQQRKPLNEPFIMRQLDEEKTKEVSILLDKYEKLHLKKEKKLSNDKQEQLGFDEHIYNNL